MLEKTYHEEETTGCCAKISSYKLLFIWDPIEAIHPIPGSHSFIHQNETHWANAHCHLSYLFPLYPFTINSNSQTHWPWRSRLFYNFSWLSQGKILKFTSNHYWSVWMGILVSHGFSSLILFFRKRKEACIQSGYKFLIINPSFLICWIRRLIHSEHFQYNWSNAGDSWNEKSELAFAMTFLSF